MTHFSTYQRVTFLLPLAAVVLLWVVGPSAAQSPTADKRLAKLVRKPRVAVTISKETTYLTGPLREDGYVDYVAALNQRESQGVTPENNAAVLLWKAVGPGEITAGCREKYFQMLGIPPLPEKGSYFVTLRMHMKRRADANKAGGPKRRDQPEELWQQESTAETRPWSAQEFPRLADWVATNQKPLELLIEASKRPRCYDPLVGDNLMAALPFATITMHREVARALIVRAVFRIQQGRPDQAWEDLLACHRLSRLLRQGPSLVVDLVGVTTDGMACAGDQRLLQSIRLTAAQVAKIRDDLAALPALPKMANRIDVGERFWFLDGVAMFARGPLPGVSALRMVGSPLEPNSYWQDVLDQIPSLVYDWDRVLRLGNFWYGQMAEASRKPGRAERKRALGRISSDIRRLVEIDKHWLSLGISMLASPRQAISNRLGYLFLNLVAPGVSAVADAEDRAAMRFDLVRIGFALAAYRADHGPYPAKLTDLAPRYFAEIPPDIFTGKQLHYTQHGDGYLLYSVGVNGKDDGGKGREDCKEGEDCDDMTVRVSAAATKN